MDAKGDDVMATVSSINCKVVNCQSCDYIFDHVKDNDVDIIALTESYVSNDEPRNETVIDRCVLTSYGFTLHHIPRHSF